MISHKHRCVFVHIPKCGGTSVEQLFLRDLGLTWDERAPLLLRPRVRQEPAPRALAHLTLEEYVSGHYMSEELMETYFKFTTVRNPLSRVTSAYKYLGAKYVMGIDQFVAEHVVPAGKDPGHDWHWFLRPQVDYIWKDSHIGVDQVVRLESLSQDLPSIAAQLGVRDVEVPHENRSKTKPALASMRSTAGGALRFRQVPRRIRAVRSPSLSTVSIRAIVDVYQRDFEMLPYSVPV